MILNYIENTPSTEDFHALLKLALDYCDGMMFVVPDAPLSEGGDGLLAQLQPWAAGKARASAWMGHTMKTGAASLQYFEYNEAVCEILCAHGQSLYDFMPPALPEGLYLTKKQTPWLVTHIRQKQAYIHGSDEQIDALKAAIPGLQFKAVEN